MDIFFKKVMLEPESLQRSDVQQVIGTCFDYTRVEWQVGELKLGVDHLDDYATQAFALAASFGANESTTVHFFGPGQKIELVDNREDTILRAFTEVGWGGVKFKAPPIVAKDEASIA